MNEQKFRNKHGVSTKTGVMMMLQVAIMIIAFAITIIGIRHSLESYRRLIIYCGQAIACVAIIVFGIFNFKKKDDVYFKSVVYAYAVLEALRASLLVGDGIADWAEVVARFIMVALTVHCAVFAQSMDNDRKTKAVSYIILCGEILLYIIFLIGFPVVRSSILWGSMPVVGVLIASSLCLFNTARIEYHNNQK